MPSNTPPTPPAPPPCPACGSTLTALVSHWFGPPRFFCADCEHSWDLPPGPDVDARSDDAA